MAYSLIAHISSPGGVSAAITTTGATLLIACVGAQDPAQGGSAFVPADSKSNTWHLAHSQVGDFAGIQAIYYAYNPTVGSGHTFTPGGSFPSGCFMAWSGAPVTDPLDQISAGGSGWPTLQPGSITPLLANSLVALTIGTGLPSVAPSVDTGYTVLDFEKSVGGVSYSSCSVYLVQTSAVAVNPTVTDVSGGGGHTTYSFQISFSPAGSGGTRLSRLSLTGAG